MIMTEQHPYKPPGPVQSILAEHVLQQELPEPHFRNLHALPKKFSISKSSKHGEGRIRVNKEVLAVLKQVSTELDAAQRHYLAFKQYGDAAESLLKLSPDIVTLPCEGLAATASQTDVAAGDTPGDAEQHTHAASDARSSGDSNSSHGAAANKDILAGRRRWGYFPMLHRLRATSAKQRRPTVPALSLEAQARRSADDIPAAAADMSAGDADVTPDSPKGNWMALMKQKKAEKEQGVARMIRIKHAVLVIQRAWRACLQRRASRALAMMVLRAKVRRAHRAAYVSNLLRKKPRGAGQAAAAEGFAAAGLGDDDGGDDVIVVDEDGEVVLTQQQEAEFELQLQKALEATQAGKATALPPELAHLAELLPDAASSNGSSATLAAMTGSAVQGTESDSEGSDEQEGEEEEAPVWKFISAPKAAPKRPLLRVETQIPGGPNWAGSLRTPGPLSSHHPSANTPHRIGSPDSPPSASRHGMHSGMSFKHSPRDRPRSHKAPRPGTSGTSRPASRAHGRLSTCAAAAGAAEAAAAGGGSTCGGDGTAGGLASDEAHGEEAGGRVSGGGRRTPRTGAAVSFAVADGSDSEAWSEGSADSAAGGDHSLAECGSEGQGEDGVGGGKTPRGVRVRKKAVSVVVASAKHAVAIANSEGGVVIRARSASKKLLKSTSRFSTAPATAAEHIAAAATAADDSVAAQSPHRSAAGDAIHHQQQGGSPANQLTGGVGSEHMSAPYCHPAAATGGSTAAAAAAAAAGSIILVSGDCMGDNAAWASQTQAAAGGHLVPGAPEAHQAAAAAAGVPAAAAKAAVEGRASRQGTAGSRRVTGCDDDVTRVSRGGSVTPPLSRRSTREVVPGGSRTCTPPPNRGFSAVSSGNGAFSRYERGLADGLQQDFQVLPAESVTASRAPTPPATTHKPTTPQRRSTIEATSRPLSASTQQPLPYEQQQLEQAQQQPWQQGQDDHQQAAVQQDGQQGLQVASRRTSRQFIKGQSGNRGFCGELELSITSRQGATGPFNAAAAAAAASQASAGATGDAESCSGPFLKISSFRGRQEAADSTGSSTNPSGMQDYAAAVAAYRAAGLADLAALGGLVLQADGSLLQLQAQQEQVVSKAEGWYRRLMKARGKAAGRQPWDQPAPPAGVGSSSSESLLGSAEQSGASGLGADSSSQIGPAGPCGRRSTVRDAWLFVDGRAAAALPWQALAAVAAAGQRQQDGTGAPEWGLSDVSGGGGGGLSQLTVRGRRLLVRLMWLKSAAAVMRGQVRGAGFLERRLVELLKVGTKPAGLDLLLWSVADEQQQAQERAELQQQQQQQLLGLQEQLRGPSGWPEGGLGGMWRQQSSPEPALEPFLHSQVVVRQKAATSSGALPAGDFGKLHGDHLPLLPAARCAPLPGSGRTTQQQQLWPASTLEHTQQQGQQQQLRLMCANPTYADVMVQQQQAHHQQQQQQQQRQWHYSVDEAVLWGQQHPQADIHTLQAALLQQQTGSWQQVAAGPWSTQDAAAAAEPMVVSRKALMRRTTTDCKPLGSSPSLAGPWWKAAACDNAGPAHAQEQPRSFTQPLPGAAAVLQQHPSPPQRDTAGVACWQLGMQQIQAAGRHAAAAAAQQPTGLQALNTKGVSVTQGLMLAVSGEGNIAMPVLRQHSSPQQLQQRQAPPQWQHQHPHQQQQPLQGTPGHPLSTPAQPHAQLWVIPELHRPQQQAMHPDSSHMFVSFVGSKPQQRRRPKQQQQNDSTHQGLLAAGQVHQQGGQGLAWGTSLTGSKSGSLWGQQQLQQGQFQGTAAVQQHSMGSLLPQLPGLQRAGQHGHPVSVTYGVRQGQQAEALMAARPVRLSSSDPGSTALLSAVAAVHAVEKPVRTGLSPSRAAAGVLSWQRMQGDQAAGTIAAEPAAALPSKPYQSHSGFGASAPRFGSHGGSVHVAVVEQQLPQLAALRVAAD